MLFKSALKWNNNVMGKESGSKVFFRRPQNSRRNERNLETSLSRRRTVFRVGSTQWHIFQMKYTALTSTNINMEATRYCAYQINSLGWFCLTNKVDECDIKKWEDFHVSQRMVDYYKRWKSSLIFNLHPPYRRACIRILNKYKMTFTVYDAFWFRTKYSYCNGNLKLNQQLL